MPKGRVLGSRWTTPEARFWKKVQKTSTCWEWIGSCAPVPNHPDRRGHGQIRVDGKCVPAHVFSWTLHHGPVPPGLYVLHHCDNRPCVRPDHLFLGTKRDNTQDALRKHRLPYGEATSWAKLTEVQVREIRRIAATRELSYCALGRQFNVCDATIRHIVHRRNWKQLE